MTILFSDYVDEKLSFVKLHEVAVAVVGNMAKKNSLSIRHRRDNNTTCHYAYRNVSSGRMTELPMGRPFPGKGPPKLTMQEEAMNTDRRHRTWASDSRFRDIPVNFQSGGAYNANNMVHVQDEPEPPDDMPASSPTSPATGAGVACTSSPMPETGGDASDTPYLSGAVEDRELFVVDVQGSEPLMGTSVIPLKVRPSSSSSSSSVSSDEVILFKGRQLTTPAPAEDTGQASTEPAHGTEIPAVAQWNPDLEAVRDWSLPTPGNQDVYGVEDELLGESFAIAPQPGPADEQAPPVDTYQQRRKRSRKSRRHRRKKFQAPQDQDDEVADYIANMQENGEDDIFNSITVTGRVESASSFVVGAEKQTLPLGRSRPTPQPQSTWGPVELQDFLELDTSDEVLGTVRSVLARRNRPGEAQYLVVWDGYSTDEARWIHQSSLTTDGALEKIQAFEERKRQQEALEQIDEDEDSDGDILEVDMSTGDVVLDPEWESTDSEDSDDEEERLKDNEDLLQRRLDRMTDEKIAKILAKQEELGLGSNDILLFDGDDEDDDEEAPKRKGHESLTRSGKRYTAESGPSSLQRKGVIDDAIGHNNAFDPMDEEGPRRRRRGKGRAAPLPFQLSDNELEATLRHAWESDRAKKTARKREREELRAQGLLGNKKGKPRGNQDASPSEYLDIEGIKSQIRTFVLSSEKRLVFPPMSTVERKMIHVVANGFSLKSKSAGSADERFTTLFKTPRSAQLDEAAVATIEGHLGKKGLLRQLRRAPADAQAIVLGKRKKNGGGAGRRPGARAGIAAASYRDGEVVGARAPEIGVENRGRAMLEKMGWSSGTALGAVDNKGRLLPVEHIVKTSKMGLG